MATPLTSADANRAFQALDAELEEPVSLVVGGGTAMMMAHGLPVRTTDVDAYPRNSSFEALLPLVRKVGKALGLSPDWLNPHYETFAHVLPRDYGTRLVPIYAGRKLEVTALGAEDLLVMKCFAGREKDVSHARALLRRKPDLGVVERRLQELAERGVKGSQDAPDYFDETHRRGRMTDLRQIPEADELPRLYHELAALGARVEGSAVPWRHGHPGAEELLVLTAQAARRDPRLLWVLVELLATRFDTFDPLKLRRAAARARWPATVGVALTFAAEAAPSAELEDYARYVTARLPRSKGERFFLGTRAFGGEQARRDAEESLAEYKRWGFLGRELPYSKELATTARGTLDPAERRNLLRRIASRRGEVTLREYLEALDGRASERQASRDLAGADFLLRRGRTRGAVWRYAPVDRSPPRPRSVRPGAL